MNLFRIAFCRRPNPFDRSQLYQSADFTEKSICSWNPITGETKNISITAEGHAVINSPIDPSISIVSPRFSEIASVVDWHLGLEVRQFKLLPGEYFYGHGAFSEDGQQLLFSGVEYVENLLHPRLFLFQLGQEKPLRKIEFKFGYPHDILHLKKNIFLISSGSKKTEGQFIIYNLDRDHFDVIKIQTSKDYNIQGTSLVHLRQFNKYVYGNLQYINDKASDFLGLGCIVRLDTETLRADLEFPPVFDFIRSEILSLDIDPLRQFLWGTLPAQKKIFIWSLKKKEMLKTISFDEIVTSISYIPNLDAMLCGQQKNMVLLNCETFESLESDNWLLDGLQKLSDKYFAHSNFS